jgi:hypothetical protein
MFNLFYIAAPRLIIMTPHSTAAHNNDTSKRKSWKKGGGPKNRRLTFPTIICVNQVFFFFLSFFIHICSVIIKENLKKNIKRSPLCGFSIPLLCWHSSQLCCCCCVCWCAVYGYNIPIYYLASHIDYCSIHPERATAGIGRADMWSSIV